MHTPAHTPKAIPDARRRLSQVAEQRLLYYKRAERNVAGTQLRFFRNRRFPQSTFINAVATASGAEPIARTEADKEQLMRTLKIGLVIVFSLAALTPAISTRVAALTATLAQSKASKEKPDKNKDAAQSKQAQPADASLYVGGES